MYISDFLALHLSEFYGYITALTNFLVKKEFLVHRPMLIFEPTVNYRTNDNRTKQCQNRISQLGKICSYELSTSISVLVEVFRRRRGIFWLVNESLTFKGLAAKQATIVN